MTNTSVLMNILNSAEERGNIAYETSTSVLEECMDLIDSVEAMHFNYAFSEIRDILDDRELEE